MGPFDAVAGALFGATPPPPLRDSGYAHGRNLARYAYLALNEAQRRGM